MLPVSTVASWPQACGPRKKSQSSFKIRVSETSRGFRANSGGQIGAGLPSPVVWASADNGASKQAWLSKLSCDCDAYSVRLPEALFLFAKRLPHEVCEDRGRAELNCAPQADLRSHMRLSI